MYYLLDEHNIPHTVDMMDFAEGVDSQRAIALDGLDDDVRISTVFLGINHHSSDGVPILFETMIFGGEYSEYQRRYETYDDAVREHNNIVKRLKNGLGPETI